MKKVKHDDRLNCICPSCNRSFNLFKTQEYTDKYKVLINLGQSSDLTLRCPACEMVILVEYVKPKLAVNKNFLLF